ncbi:hypothetical protein, partial [Escherichia coli]|uniref:hypothetical protein n=1 Tax=Escherichia coli TaxID=562 RepID=UPI001BC84DAF
HCASSPVRGLCPVTGLRRALFFLKSIFTGSWATLRKEMIHMKPVMVHGLVMILMPELYKTLKK